MSENVPLMARVYPNGLADVNHFHAAGGLGYMIGELLEAGLLHPDTKTIDGHGAGRIHRTNPSWTAAACVGKRAPGTPERPHPAPATTPLPSPAG